MWNKKHAAKSAGAIRAALLVVLVALLALGGSAQAQSGESITYGTSIVGNLTADMPFAIYNLTMNAGDMMSVVVAGLTPEMSPSIGMVGPDQLPIAEGSTDALSPAGSHLARLSHRATQTGSHTLIVTNVNNTGGQFVLVLDGGPAPLGMPLALNAPQTISLPLNAAPAVYSFQPSPASNLVLGINTTTPGFSFLARVFDGRGHLVANLAGVDVRGVTLDIGPGSGQYLVEVGALTPNMQGTLQIGLVAGGAEPVVIPQVPAITATPSICQATGANRVNVRSGPGTAYPAFGSLLPDSSLPVVGRSSTTSWYVVDYGGRQGWVSGSVVQVGGPCGALPFVPDPPLPVTPTPIPTATPTTPVVNFTSTIADGATYPAGTCFTFYWSVANVREVYFDGQGVSGVGQREACPAASRAYVLRVIYPDGSSRDFPIYVTITP